MIKSIVICTFILLTISSLSFAENEEKSKEEPETKTVYYNIAPQPQPGPNTIENSTVRRICVQVPVDENTDD